MREMRPDPEYFRVGYFGKGFPSFLQVILLKQTMSDEGLCIIAAYSESLDAELSYLFFEKKNKKTSIVETDFHGLVVRTYKH